MFRKLEEVFLTAAIKYLAAVDVSNKGIKRTKKNRTAKSNQHEIGGLVRAGISQYLTTPPNGEKLKFQATMAYLSDDSDEPLIVENELSWYDTRFNTTGRGPEWRLYYKENEVTHKFQETDFMLVALTKETRKLLIVFCPQDSKVELHLRAIFGAITLEANNQLKEVPIRDSSISAPVALLLSQLNLDSILSSKIRSELKDELIEKFSDSFPTTRVFSEYTRSKFQDFCPVESPDNALLQWMEEEENLFRELEKHFIKKQLLEGFGPDNDDVEKFIKVSLSIQNRRKSRVGHAFENHIEEVLIRNKISFERGVKTEGKQKPDFLFPSREAYLDPNFSDENLRILGAKTTCKERWRQVLAEANRINKKHLITLEPSISSDQTTQMKEKKLQLVVPEAIQSTYKPEQREWLMTFKNFISDMPKP